MTHEEMLSAALADRDKEIDRLRAELDDLQSIRRIYEAQLDRQALELGYARAAIARVRELTDRAMAAGADRVNIDDVHDAIGWTE